jgi:sulfide dehydrogenase [flavocytochrome c] flavoprotein subunit
LKVIGATGVLAAGSLRFPGLARANTGGQVIVVGGGFGGAICANYLRKFDPSLKVTLIEPKDKYLTCPFSNTVIGGINPLSFITHSYDKLGQKRGVTLVRDWVEAIDPKGKQVKLKGGNSLGYDALVVAPGIEFRWDQIEGYDEATSQRIPHAWQAGEQTTLLHQQLTAIKDGGVVIIATPPPPFRAPPAPFERASLIAHYLKQAKPKSKVLIVDASDPDPELVALFKQAWEELYPGMIEIAKVDRIARLDVKAMKVFSASGEAHAGDVINLIPPQQAGSIAKTAELTGADGWCPVNQRTFESVKHKAIHVIGDACDAGEMPKLGHSASIQGKICAAAIVSGLQGTPMPEPFYSCSIYSLIGPKYAISHAADFRLTGGRIQAVSGGHSQASAPPKVRVKEAEFAAGWYQSITAEMFAG